LVFRWKGRKILKTTFLNRFKSGRVRTSAAVILVIVLSVLIYVTYDGYRDTIVTQQQQNMLGNAKSISRSIELFISDTVDSMKIITLDKEFLKGISYVEQGKVTNDYIEKIKTYYQAGGKEVDSVYFIDKDGKILTRYPQGTSNVNETVLRDIEYALAKRSTYIGNAYLDKEKKNFILNIYEPVFDEDKFKGLVSSAVNLDVIYDKLIAPVKVGEKGYALVKDQQGIIIMHTVKEQVGMDVIETRKEVFPNLDYKELEDLIDAQLRGEEGTAIYHSYWWGENVLKKVKKLNAYTPVKLGEKFWVVALTMSYDEIQGPINRFLAKIVAIVTLIAIIIFFFISALLRMKRNKEELEKEANHLKMLNEASEQLRKEEAEMYHSHKLKMIGTLAGGIAHDINNLLTPILGYSELLMMQIPQDGEHYEEIEEIYKASQKGKDLIQQILAFSRKDNGIVKVEPVDINEVTRETVKLLKSVIPKNVTIKENIKKDCGYVKANFTQLHQIVFNLCTNGYQAIKENKGVLEVSLEQVEGKEAHAVDNTLSEDRIYVRLSVRDTGVGMDEQTKARIFEPFFTTKNIGEGTGLGLFVVQSIIDKYEGVIRVESEKGVGSCFEVYLPLIEEDTDYKHAEHISEEEGFNKKVLIVDDNEDVIRMLTKGMEHMGYEVVAETDCLKALELFETVPEEFHLVITDFRMPKLKGNELAAKIKELNKAVKVILITGYMDESLEVLSNSNTIDACLAKPIQIARLCEVTKELLTH
jgi:two-component system, cell cycle sensor histidine kinase and response regulator CckA